MLVCNIEYSDKKIGNYFSKNKIIILHLKIFIWLQTCLKFSKKSFLLQLCNEPRSKASVHQIKALNILSDPARATDRSYRSTSDLK